MPPSGPAPRPCSLWGHGPQRTSDSKGKDETQIVQGRDSSHKKEKLQTEAAIGSDPVATGNRSPSAGRAHCQNELISLLDLAVLFIENFPGNLLVHDINKDILRDIVTGVESEKFKCSWKGSVNPTCHPWYWSSVEPFLKNKVWTREMAPWITCLLCNHEDMSWVPHTNSKAENSGRCL